MVLTAVLLTALLAAADRAMLSFTYHTKIDVATAAQVAMILTLPPAWPGLLVMLALAATHIQRRADPAEALFNIAQAGIYVSAGAYGFFAARALFGAVTGWQADVAVVVSLVVASAILHLVNTLLISAIVSLQMNVNPLRGWVVNLLEDVPAHVALTALGGVAAIVAMSQPLALPLLALPVVLVRYAVGRTIQLRSDTADALAALVEVVELRDAYTAGHSRRVAETARLLALELGLTAEEADRLESAGKVHDIGKVAIDPLVLSKPGKLDDAERQQMQMHPVYGADVIQRFNAYEQGYALVRHHHEAWDGSGYPDGLIGDAIPLGARILAVADTWDALTSDRPYRRGMDPAVARRILIDGAGKQWDPQVIDALMRTLESAPQPASMPLAALSPVPA